MSEKITGENLSKARISLARLMPSITGIIISRKYMSYFSNSAVDASSTLLVKHFIKISDLYHRRIFLTDL